MATVTYTLTGSGSHGAPGVVSQIQNKAPFALRVKADPLDLYFTTIAAADGSGNNGGTANITGGQKGVVVEFPRGQVGTADVALTFTPDPLPPSTGGATAPIASIAAGSVFTGNGQSAHASLRLVGGSGSVLFTNATQGTSVALVAGAAASAFAVAAGDAYRVDAALLATGPARIE